MLLLTVKNSLIYNLKKYIYLLSYLGIQINLIFK